MIARYSNKHILSVIFSILSQIPIDESHICLCNNCPSDPDAYSKCCFQDLKTKEICINEGVTCVTRVAKMLKIWDKVKHEKKHLNNIIYFKDVLEITLNAYDEILCLGCSTPPENK